jgi:hypothetical protein
MRLRVLISMVGGVIIYLFAYGYPHNAPAFAVGRIAGGGLTIAIVVFCLLSIVSGSIRRNGGLPWI